MAKRTRRTLITACVVAALSGPLAAESQGGVLLDWLFGRRTGLFQPWGTTAYYPAASMNQPGGVAMASFNTPAVPAAGTAQAAGQATTAYPGATVLQHSGAQLATPAGMQAAGHPGVQVMSNPGTVNAGNPGVTVMNNPGVTLGNPGFAPGVSPGASFGAVPGTTFGGIPGGAAVGQPGLQAGVQRAVVSYSPHTRFRTAWVQVPVTQYRSAVTVDPTTGCPVTTQQPCTTHVWQARRIPQFGSRAMVAAPTTGACNGCPPLTTPGPGTFGPIPGPTMTTPTPAPAPYYTPPAGAPAGSPSPVPMPGQSPADQPPTLPGTPQQTQRPQIPSTQYYPPATQYSAPQTQYAVPGTQYRPLSNPPAASNGQAPSATGQAPANTPPTVNGPAPGNSQPPAQGQSPASDSPSQGASTSSAGQRRPVFRGNNPHNLQPVPDPEPEGSRANPSGMPRVLNPRDRTAARPVQQAWAYTPITWPQGEPAHARRGDAPPAPAPVRQETVRQETVQQWDDSGWQSSPRW